MSSAACTNIANVCSLPDPPAVRSAHPVDIGQRTEAIVLAALVRRGYRVLTPFGTNQRYDLAIDVGDRFLRAQCKTGRLRRGTIIFAVRSVRSNTRRTYLRTYENEVDLFLVYCPETDRVYAIPIEEATSSVGALRVAPTANGQAKGIRWACEYELPE
jgi:PD-(D/E)XK nuclease superfamily protein